MTSKVATIVPSGLLKHLAVSDIKKSRSNPRLLFDAAPLKELRDNIRTHGVLVPITVYPIKGQDRYGILDGERRYRCCLALQNEEGIDLKIPANIVDPPDAVAGMVYMFSIHNFREQWELMPTALALKAILDQVGDSMAASNRQISTLTGLSDAQIERCRKLLTFDEKYQNLSLEVDAKLRIPSNFWIEALPVINLYEETTKETKDQLTRDEVTDRLVEKYRLKKIKSVIHFRRVIAAWELATSNEDKDAVRAALVRFVNEPGLETRDTFDGFVVDAKRVQTTIGSCDDFLKSLQKGKLATVVEGKEEIAAALKDVQRYIQQLLEEIAGEDAPPAPEDDEDEEE
jgi:ParB/RepB/Spo0J family partition protein